MRPTLTRLWHRLGRRGGFLLFLALLDLLYAGSLLSPAPEAARSQSVRFIATIMPLRAWAILWAVAGILCLVQAWQRRDAAAFGATVCVKTLWGLLYFVGWAAVGVERGWVSAAIWIPFAGVALLISSWPEPPRLSADDQA